MPGWLSRLSIRLLISAPVTSSRFVSSSPTSGSAQPVQSLLGIPSPSPLPLPGHTCPLSLKINKFLKTMQHVAPSPSTGPYSLGAWAPAKKACRPLVLATRHPGASPFFSTQDGAHASQPPRVSVDSPSCRRLSVLGEPALRPSRRPEASGGCYWPCPAPRRAGAPPQYRLTGRGARSP